jgi:hypothetical protein
MPCSQAAPAEPRPDGDAGIHDVSFLTTFPPLAADFLTSIPPLG